MSDRLDITRRGENSYDSGQWAAVIECLRRATTYLTTVDIAQKTGIPGRTVRAILSDADGVEFLLAGGDDGYKVAAIGEEGDSLTARLSSQVTTMLARLERRRKFPLSRRQEGLF